jgi:ABC-type transporter Mla subunit MlaD
MAKRGRKAGGKLGDFAETLGTLLGSAEHSARGWLDQRKQIASQLAQVRDKADQLLRELTGGAANMAVAVTRSRKTAKKTTSRKGRTFTAAQRKEQGERMRAYWAKRKAKSAKKRTRNKAAADKVGTR